MYSKVMVSDKIDTKHKKWNLRRYKLEYNGKMYNFSLYRYCMHRKSDGIYMSMYINRKKYSYRLNLHKDNTYTFFRITSSNELFEYLKGTYGEKFKLADEIPDTIDERIVHEYVRYVDGV